MDQDFEKRLLKQQNGPPISPILSVSVNILYYKFRLYL